MKVMVLNTLGRCESKEKKKKKKQCKEIGEMIFTTVPQILKCLGGKN